MFIFTECFNCAKIAAIALESFHKHHDLEVHLFGTQADFNELGIIHPNTILVDLSNDTSIMDSFKSGHRGTATIFAKAFYGSMHQQDLVVHFDSDVVFVNESMSMMQELFNMGHDIIGSKRCYGNNPSGIKGLEKYPDTMSTYFFGMRISKIPAYSFDYFIDMWEGRVHPLGYPVLDFGDAVVHAAISNGAKVNYLPQMSVGGQNDSGKKNSIYDSNMHLDVGSHLIHFGGVGSGYAYFNGKSNPQESYANWAVGRWSLFAKLFYNIDIGYREPTMYTADGRWGNGNYDSNIFNKLLNDMGYSSEAHYNWVKDDAEHKRYEFDLNENSFVIDAGGYKGDWSAKIHEMYNCKINIFEPASCFAYDLIYRFHEIDGVYVYDKGISDTNKTALIYLNKDSTTLHSGIGESEEIKLINFNEFIKNIAIVDLIKINIEGEEYPLLKSIIESGNQTKLKNILVQFHNISSNSLSEKEWISNELKKTHHLTFCYEMIWENWEINK